MINVAPIRAAADAAPGDLVVISKPQLAELLCEIEAGQQALRHLKVLGMIETLVAEAPRVSTGTEH